MRTKNSAKNVIVSLVGQGLCLPVSFFARIIFIQTLGKEYLGLNGLFTNILTMLSLVELGIGPAIIYSLYKPLAQKNIDKIQALMKFYQKAYVCIGLLIAFLGFCITPFLDYVIKDLPEVPFLKMYFLLFTLNSAVSYFYSYKRSLIIADQKRYIATYYRYGFFLLLNILQIVFLVQTRNYTLFLLLQIGCTLGENILISQHADRIYPFLKNRVKLQLEHDVKKQIYKNTSAMVLHKIGSIVVNSTDNILISSMVGTILVGLYSNYQLIIQALHMILGQVFTAFTASIGNLGATDSPAKTREVFDAVFFIGFWLYGFSTICLFFLMQPFITLWLGDDMLLPTGVMMIIIVNFYVKGMRQAGLTFRDALGLYWYDRYKPLLEVLINLVASIALTYRFGIAGIFLGTLISSMTTCFWIEPYVLYKYGLKCSVRTYFMKYVLYSAATLLAGYITWTISHAITSIGFTGFIQKAIICLVCPNLVFLLFFVRTKEFRLLVKKFIMLIHSLRKRA